MTRKAIIAGVLVALAVVAVIAARGKDSSDRPSVDPHISEHQNYHQVQYDAGIVNSWAPGMSDRRVGAYLESSWRVPGEHAAVVTISSRPADEAGSAAAAAELARIQANIQPGYHGGGLNEIRLRGIPAVRWSFNLGGTKYLEYFFEECGIDFVVRASAPSATWSELASLFHEMAATITAKCDE